MTPNPDRKKAAGSTAAAGIFAILGLVAYGTPDGVGGGHGIAFVSLFLAVCASGAALLFVRRSRVADAILADPSPLAHWIYPADMARTIIEREYRDHRDRNRKIFLLMGGIVVAAAFVMTIFFEDTGPETGIFLLAVIVILYAVLRVTPWLEKRRALEVPREAIITREGILCGASAYRFRTFLASRDRLSLRRADKKNPAALVFSFTRVAGAGFLWPFNVVVPVPPGEEERAERVMKDLGNEGQKIPQ